MATTDKSWGNWLQTYGFESTLPLPEPLLQKNWSPNQDDQTAAWHLYTEMRTRITTQPLHHLDGSEAGALESVYQLFPTSRLLMQKYPLATHFSELSVYFLNKVIRPFTARWHQWSTEGKLQNEHARTEFRTELSRLQTNMRDFCTLLGRLAAGENFVDVKDRDYLSVVRTHNLCVDPPLQLPTHYTAGKNPASANQMLELEKHAIHERRAASGTLAEDTKNGAGNYTGLALSGGGIRSATLCIGVLQRLGQTSVLKDIDYLSTVSGGGYAGSFISNYVDVDQDNVGLDAGKEPFGRPTIESPAIMHLRNNSRYLLSGGFKGTTKALAQMLYGIFIQFFALLFVLCLLAGLVLGVSKAVIAITGGALTLTVLGILLASVWLIVLFIMPLVQSRGTPQQIAKVEPLAIWFGILVGVVLLSILLVHAHALLTDKGYIVPTFKWLLLSSIAAPIVLGTIGYRIGLSKTIGKVFMRLAFVTGTAMIFILIALVFTDVASVDKPSTILSILWKHKGITFSVFVPAIILSISLFFVNVNFITLHRFYKNRLGLAYIIGQSEEGSEISKNKSKKLSALRSVDKSLPYHLINTTLNGSSPEGTDFTRRGADFFLCSQLYCGSESTGYWPTSEIEKHDNLFDLGTAMAVSGAAMSPNMGTLPLKWARKLLAGLNLRLNYWLPNPAANGSNNLPGIKELFHEYRGSEDIEGPFLNLSDGGHIENLGLYELIKRQCKFIIAIDGESDSAMTRSSLNKIVRLARQDFNAIVSIDTARLELDTNGLTRAHFAFGTITYRNVSGANNTGYLLYLKSSLTGNEPHDVLDYKRRNPTFPHQTTADQFFDEEQFEAYRALGFHMCEELFSEEMMDLSVNDNQINIKDLMQQLANRYIFREDNRRANENRSARR